MKKSLTADERLERLRLLAERRDLDRLDQRTPSQLRRLVDLERLLEGGSNGASEKRGRSKKESEAA